MLGRTRVGISAAMTVGIALGPGGCSDFWDLDPPDRIDYEGAHEEQVYACGRLTMGGMWQYTEGVGIRFLVGEISIEEESPDVLTIEGRTRYESAGEEVVRDWVCRIETGRLDAEIVSENTFVEAP